MITRLSSTGLTDGPLPPAVPHVITTPGDSHPANFWQSLIRDMIEEELQHPDREIKVTKTEGMGISYLFRRDYSMKISGSVQSIPGEGKKPGEGMYISPVCRLQPGLQLV